MPHTPGPWEMLTYSVDCDHSIEIAHDIQELGNGKVQAAWVCSVENVDMDITEEVEANACLIAAAPELYEALDGFMTLYDRNDAVKLEEWWPVYAKARRALDKAKGEEVK